MGNSFQVAGKESIGVAAGHEWCKCSGAKEDKYTFFYFYSEYLYRSNIPLRNEHLLVGRYLEEKVKSYHIYNSYWKFRGGWNITDSSDHDQDGLEPEMREAIQLIKGVLEAMRVVVIMTDDKIGLLDTSGREIGADGGKIIGKRPKAKEVRGCGGKLDLGLESLDASSREIGADATVCCRCWRSDG